MMVIIVHPVMVIVVFWIILMEQAQKAPHPLSQREGKDKADKINLLYQTNKYKLW